MEAGNTYQKLHLLYSSVLYFGKTLTELRCTQYCDHLKKVSEILIHTKVLVDNKRINPV